MFLRHSVHLRLPCDQCVHELLTDDGAWFPRLLYETGDQDGERFALVGFRAAGVPVRKRVTIRFARPRRLGSQAQVEIAWRPTSAGGLLPDFQDRVEVAPVEPGLTSVTVSGIYQPPGGGLGGQLDRAMHRVAEAAVKELANHVARELDALIEARQPQAAGPADA